MLEETDKAVNLHESIFEDDSAIIDKLLVESEGEDEFNEEAVRERFCLAIDAYKEKVLAHHSQNTQEPSII